MRRKAAAALMLAVLLLFAPAAGGPFKKLVSAEADIHLVVRGTELVLSTDAFIENGNTVVPLREISEALGAEVSYETGTNDKQIITLKRNDRTASLTIGSAVMTANGKSIRLDAPARLHHDVTMVPLRAISESLGTVVAWDASKRIISIDDPIELPAVGSEEKLRKLMETMGAQNQLFNKSGVVADGISREESAEASAPASDESKSSSDYSQTNVQVGGVDEADWAKTDGRFIYQLSGSRVLISDIANSAKPKLAATLDYPAKDGFTPQELYVDDKRLVVIGQRQVRLPYNTATDGDLPVSGGAASRESGLAVEATSDAKRGIWMPIPMLSTVKTFIYELNEAVQPKLVRETEQEGSYSSSRKIGSALYVVTNKNNFTYPLYDTGKDGGNAAKDQLATSFQPLYSDSAVSSDLKSLPLDSIRYFPESPDANMLLVGAIDLDAADQPLQLSAYLGSSQTIYASEKHLYVAISKYTADGDAYKQETQIHKFRLDQGRIVYIGEGSVPGTILNQFSMDEHEGYFRIALTKGDMWASSKDGSTNNLYVLDEKLNTVGKLEGLAPGERIYSVRFMGGRAYMVTFRNVDPLFAIDLNNPVKPAVLGQLKIPGYSDYLHPYDENHIIGFGKETVEIPSKGTGTDQTMAFYQGMKIALFDVSDVSHPKEKFKETIGDRGTNSELLHDHKALLFSKEKGLLAFPVELLEIKNKETLKPTDSLAYGEFTYQGAYVYGIDLKKGFTLRSKITHLTAEDLAKSGQYGYDYEKAVRRILYAGDTLYTLSDHMLKANNLSSLKESGSLVYPAKPKESTIYPDGRQVQPVLITE
jgi:inhibitor of cysteine peptidase